jgi:uncharacterized protein (TIGR03437 family)
MVSRVWLVLVLSSLFAAAQTAGPALQVNAGAGGHPISPDIYGANDFDDDGIAAQLHIGVRRFGGDATTRYNWKLDAYNAGSDWFFENFPMGNSPAPALPDASRFNQLMELSRRTGNRMMNTISMIGWLPKSRERGCSFPVSTYGPPKKDPNNANVVDPYNPDCGNGTDAAGNNIPVTDQIKNSVSMPVASSFARDWVQYLVDRYGTAARGGVSMYALDNEPVWWMGVHRDVHPDPATYDEVLSRGIDYASAIKSADPTALVAGPVSAGWESIFYSAADLVNGWHTGPDYKYWNNPVDRNAHGGVAFVEWYLQKMHAYEQQHGKRLLDYLDLHAYIAPSGLSFGSAGDPATDALRLRSTRVFWDANYTEALAEDTHQPFRLIPRMHEWVNNDYPGTRLAITEYNWGALDNINGALAQADLLGIFGREGLDVATLWGPPKASQPGAFAFRIYINYDGHGSTFGETAVQASTADADRLAIYAAQRSDGAITIVAINKTNEDLSSSIALSGFQPSGDVEVWQYSSANLNAIVRGTDVKTDASGFSALFPASSITLLVVPPDPATLAVPKPVVQSIANAASPGAAVAPGTIILITGSGMGPEMYAAGVVTADQFIDTAAAGTRVLINGTPAPVLYASATRVYAVIPYAAAFAPTIRVQAEYRGSRSEAEEMPLSTVAPALFTSGVAGSGQAIALNEDSTFNGAGTAAARGSTIYLYGTGEGEMSVPAVDGRILLAGDPAPLPKVPVSVEIAGTEVSPISATTAIQAVSGALQIAVRIPDSVTPGAAVPVRIKAGTASSQDGVTIAVR